MNYYSSLKLYNFPLHFHIIIFSCYWLDWILLWFSLKLLVQIFIKRKTKKKGKAKKMFKKTHRKFLKVVVRRCYSKKVFQKICCSLFLIRLLVFRPAYPKKGTQFYPNLFLFSLIDIMDFSIYRGETQRCTLSLRQFFATGSPLKMMKNTFYFTLKALFVLKIPNFWSCRRMTCFKRWG